MLVRPACWREAWCSRTTRRLRTCLPADHELHVDRCRTRNRGIESSARRSVLKSSQTRAGEPSSTLRRDARARSASHSKDTRPKRTVGLEVVGHRYERLTKFPAHPVPFKRQHFLTTRRRGTCSRRSCRRSSPDVLDSLFPVIQRWLENRRASSRKEYHGSVRFIGRTRIRDPGSSIGRRMWNGRS